MKSNAVLLQPREGRHLGKHRGHQGRLGPSADQLPAGALPQHGADGVNDNGFACTGLTGEDVVARFKADVRRLDQGDIFDMKQGKQTITPSLPRLLQQFMDLPVKLLGGGVVPHNENAGIIARQAAYHSRNIHAVQGGTGRRGQAGHGTHHYDILC